MPTERGANLQGADGEFVPCVRCKPDSVHVARVRSTIEIRRGVAIVQVGAEAQPAPEVDVSMPSLEFKKLLAGLDSGAGFLLTGNFEFRTGGRSELASFLAFFKE